MLCFFLLASCSFNKDESIELSFMPDIYPYTDTVYASHYNNLPFYEFGQQKSSKLIFYVSGDCSSCFSRIVKWQKYLKTNELFFSDVAKAIVIETEQLPKLEYNLEKIENTIPIYIDTLNSFRTFNNLCVINSSSIFISHDNKILAYNVEEMSFKKIKSLSKDSFNY